MRGCRSFGRLTMRENGVRKDLFGLGRDVSAEKVGIANVKISPSAIECLTAYAGLNIARFVLVRRALWVVFSGRIVTFGAGVRLSFTQIFGLASPLGVVSPMRLGEKLSWTAGSFAIPAVGGVILVFWIG